MSIQPNLSRLIIAMDGSLIDKVNSFIVANGQYSSIIQVIAPFPSTDSVSVNYYLRNARQSDYTQYMKLMKDNLGNPVLGKDVIETDREYYQLAKDWNVWQIPISSKTLRGISKYHSGKIDVSITFREFSNYNITETMTYKGTFGTNKSTTGGDLPSTSLEGDYYKCDYLDFYSYNANEYFTLLDLAIWSNGKWIKGSVYQVDFVTPTTEFGVDPSIWSVPIQDVETTMGERILSRVSDLETIVIGQLDSSDLSSMYSRTNMDLNYDIITDHNGSDYLYIERDRVGKTITKDTFMNNLNEVSSTTLRTNSSSYYNSGRGLYIDNDYGLFGSSTGPGLTWDGINNKLYIRGTLEAAEITDPNLLEQLKGDPGPTGPIGPQGPSGEQGIQGPEGQMGTSYNFKGVLTYLSDLTLISGQQLNDSYRILETGELYIWDGTQWSNMGKIEGPQGPQGEIGPQGPPPPMVKVSGEQVFKYLADSTTPTQDTITLTAELIGEITTYLWQYYNGTSWIDLSGTNNTSTYTLSYNQTEWDTKQTLMIRCYSTSIYDSAYDFINIYKLYDGNNGVDGVTNIIGYLTEPNVVLQSKYDGTDYDLTPYGLSNSEIYLKMFYGVTDISNSTNTSYSVTTVGTTSTTKNGLTLSINTVGRIYLTGDTWSTDREVFDVIGTYSGVNITLKLVISKSRAGSPGSGLTYQGIYDSSKTYSYDAIRRDIVSYNGSKYAVKDMGTTVTGTWDSTKWELMLNFNSVATDILLTQDATITKGLVMGTATEVGNIHSYGMSSLDTGNGFWLNGDGKFRFGSSDGNNINWDNNSLNIIVGNDNIESSKVKNILDSNGFSIIDVNTNTASSWFSKDDARIKNLQVDNINPGNPLFKKIYNGGSVTYYVGPTSTGDGTGRDSSNLCNSINKALENATKGCKILSNGVTITISINEGEYNETLNIDGYEGGKIIFKSNMYIGSDIIVINSNTPHKFYNNNTSIEFEGYSSSKTHFLMTDSNSHGFDIQNTKSLVITKCSFVGGKSNINIAGYGLKCINSVVFTQYCSFSNYEYCVFGESNSIITTYNIYGSNINTVWASHDNSQIYFEGHIADYNNSQYERGSGGWIRLLENPYTFTTSYIPTQNSANSDPSVFDSASQTNIIKKYYGLKSTSYTTHTISGAKIEGQNTTTTTGICESYFKIEPVALENYKYDFKIGYLKFNRDDIYSDANSINNGYKNSIYSGKIKLFYIDENVKDVTDVDNKVKITFIEGNDILTSSTILPGGTVSEYSKEFLFYTDIINNFESVSSGDITFKIELLDSPSWITLDIEKSYIELNINTWL